MWYRLAQPATATKNWVPLWNPSWIKSRPRIAKAFAFSLKIIDRFIP